ncbi:MAG: hypothetical protein AVW06_04565 [Hadesarchaea archaeon DG-33-1]|nr:MAG: hypothetical protein AVW06_04565 [Hadesarchaea archaeon DG-33-1]
MEKSKGDKAISARRKREPELNLPVRKLAGIRRRRRLIEEVVEEAILDNGTSGHKGKHLNIIPTDKYNPARLDLCTIGELRFFCYPFSMKENNLDNIYVSLKGQIAPISLQHMRLLRCLANRGQSVKQYVEKGYRNKRHMRRFQMQVLKASKAGLEQKLASQEMKTLLIKDKLGNRPCPVRS